MKMDAPVMGRGESRNGHSVNARESRTRVEESSCGQENMWTAAEA